MYFNSKAEDLIDSSSLDRKRKRDASLFFFRTLFLSIISYVIKSCGKANLKGSDASASSSASSHDLYDPSLYEYDPYDPYSTASNKPSGAGEKKQFGGQTYVTKDQRFDGNCGPEAIRQSALWMGINDAETMRSLIVDTVANTIRLNNILIDYKDRKPVNEDRVRGLFKDIFHDNKYFYESLLQHTINYPGCTKTDIDFLEKIFKKSLCDSNLDFYNKLLVDDISRLVDLFGLVSMDPIDHYCGKKFNGNLEVSEQLIEEYIAKVKQTNEWQIDAELEIAKTFGLHKLGPLHGYAYKTNVEIPFFLYVFIKDYLECINKQEYKSFLGICNKLYKAHLDKAFLNDNEDSVGVSVRILEGFRDASKQDKEIFIESFSKFIEQINLEKNKFVYLYNDSNLKFKNGQSGSGNHWIALERKTAIDVNLDKFEQNPCDFPYNIDPLVGLVTDMCVFDKINLG